MPRAKAAARLALALDPGLAEGHGWSGVASLLFDWDWEAAESLVPARRSSSRPDYSLAHAWYAVLLMSRSRHDEAIARSERAAEIDPLALSIHAVIGQCHHYARRFDEALARHRATLELDPDNVRALLWTARTYRAMGPSGGRAACDRAGHRSLESVAQAARRAGRGAGTAWPPGRSARDSWRAEGLAAAMLCVAVPRGHDLRRTGGGERIPPRTRADGSGAIWCHPVPQGPGIRLVSVGRMVPGSAPAHRGGVKTSPVAHRCRSAERVPPPVIPGAASCGPPRSW